MSRRSYRQYCSLARALDVVGDRWTMLILRNLLLGGQRYGELQSGLPGVATNLLAERLKRLQEDGVIELVDDTYVLTDMGRELESALFELANWGSRHLMGPPESDDRTRLRYGMTSVRRRMRPSREKATLRLEIGDESYVIACGPDPEVVQDDGRLVDGTIVMEFPEFRRLFFEGKAPPTEHEALLPVLRAVGFGGSKDQR